MNRIKHLKINASSNYTLVLTAFIIALLNFLFEEKITIRDGLGFDGGRFYGIWAKDFYNQVFNVGVSDIYIQRILPSAIIHYSLRLLSIPLTNANVITAFSIYNLILITLIAYIWCLIANELKISVQGKWLGFTGLFLNYVVLKYTFYYPVLTDTSAYAIGTLMIFFFLKNRLVSLSLITVIGAFVWPTAIYIGTLLLIFPKDTEYNHKFIPVRFNLNIFIALSGSFIFFLWIKYLLYRNYGIGMGANRPILSLINLSIAISMVYLFYGVSNILNNNNFFNLSYLFNKIKIKRQIFILLIFFIIKGVQLHFSVSKGFGIKSMIDQVVYTSIIQPGIFYIAHVIFYGPVLILALFLWKPLCQLIQKYGIGLTICIVFSFILSLESESRHLILYYPFFIPFIVKVTDSLKWKRSYYWFIAVLSILLSKVWLTINLEQFSINDNFLEFPGQYYAMSHGPWISHEMYITQGAIVLFSMFLIYIIMFCRINGAIKH